MVNSLADMGDEELLALDNQLCFLLYSSSRMMTALYRPLLDRLGLTYPQYLVLLVMWEFQGANGDGGKEDRDKGDRNKDDPSKEITIKMLGERLLLDTGTLTPLLKRMEQQGLLVRQRAVNDERKVLVSLTPKAQELKAGAAEVPRALLCHSTLGDKELVEIRDGLRLLLNELVSK